VIEEKRRSFLAAQVGRTLSVLTLEEARPNEKLERQAPEDQFPLALSSNYVRVALPGAALPRNTLLDVRVARAAGGLLYGYAEAD